MEKRESNSKANSTTYLKMLNDFKMKDQLRSDTSSLDGKISFLPAQRDGRLSHLLTGLEECKLILQRLCFCVCPGSRLCFQFDIFMILSWLHVPHLILWNMFAATTHNF